MVKFNLNDEKKFETSMLLMEDNIKSISSALSHRMSISCAVITAIINDSKITEKERKACIEYARSKGVLMSMDGARAAQAWAKKYKKYLAEYVSKKEA